MTSARRVAFIICTEPAIERQSILFAESLRTFGGPFAGAQIMSFAPRPAISISSTTRATLERFGVEHVDSVDNAEWADYPFGNKPIARALAEASTEADVLVFADSDIIVLNPRELLALGNADVAVRPVEARHVGITSLNDDGGAEVEYWRRLYALADVTQQETVRTTVTDEEILAYWNTGVMAVRRQLGLFQRWRAIFEQSMRAGIKPRSGRTFAEQATFAAAVLGMPKLRRIELPSAYNYPGQHHGRLPPGRRAAALADVTMLHYHQTFRSHSPAAWARGFEPDYRREWVIAKIREHGLAAPLTRIIPPLARQRLGAMRTWLRSAAG